MGGAEWGEPPVGCEPELIEPFLGLFIGGTALAEERALEGEAVFVGFGEGAPQVVHAAEVVLGAGEGEVYWGIWELENWGNGFGTGVVLELVHALSFPILSWRFRSSRLRLISSSRLRYWACCSR